ncbi:hypothetical protein VZT92_008452 [Zoarces viviparus]|uniref:Uncharacterized protein n=1 Tax=Zoarces viviparus TaxID=48416 RepID=A0AAW1FGI7_ZOAVI
MEREEERDVDRGGLRDTNPLNNKAAAGATKTTTSAAGTQCWKRQLGDLGVPQGIRLGPPVEEAFCQLRAAGLQGQFGHARPSQPWRKWKTNPHCLARKHL